MRTNRPLSTLSPRTLLFFAALSPFGGLAESEPPPYPERQHVLVIGKVSQQPKKHYHELKTIVDYAVEKMGEHGITESRIVFAADNQEMIDLLRDRRIDWVSESLYSSLEFAEKAGTTILLKRWKERTPTYSTVFFSRKDSGIRTLSDLKGKTLALEDRGSTSSFFLPITTLLREGIGVQPLRSLRDKAAPDKVGYAFAGSEINVTAAVHEGLTDAGAYSNLNWQKREQAPGPMKRVLSIFHRTRLFPHALVVIGKHVDATVTRRLKQVLLNAHADPTGISALNAYQETRRYQEIDEQEWQILEEARQMLPLLDGL